MLLINLVANDKANAAIKELTKNSRLATAKLLGLGTTMKAAFGGALAYASIRQVGTALTAVVKIANDYELAMRKVGVVSGSSVTAMSNLDSELKKFSSTTEFSAVELANASLELVKMGVTAEGVKDVLPNAMNMATVAGEELRWTSENLLNVMRAFGIDTSESARVADVMTIALNGTSMNLKDLMEGFTYVSSIAGGLNYGLEETTAMLGILSDVAIKGSLGGTALKNSMLKLIDPTDAVSSAMADFKGNGKSLTDVLEHLHKKGMSVKEMFKQFDLRALPAALVGGQAENVKRIRELMKLMQSEDIGGIAKKQADEIREAYSIAWKQVANEAGLAGIALQEVLGPTQKELANALKDALKDLVSGFKDNKEEINEIASTAIKVLNFGLKTSVSVVEALTHNWKLLVAAMTMTSIAGAISTYEKIRLKMVAIDIAAGGANKKFLSVPKSLSSAADSLNAYVLVFVSLKTAMDAAFTAYTNHLDKMQKAFSDNVRSNKRVAQLKAVVDAYTELAEAEAQVNKLHKEGSKLAWDATEVRARRQRDVKKLISEYKKEYGDDFEVSSAVRANNAYQNLTKTLKFLDDAKKALEKDPDKDKGKKPVKADEEKKAILDAIKSKGIFKDLEDKVGQVEAWNAKTGKSKGLIWSMVWGDNSLEYVVDGIQQIEDAIKDVQNKTEKDTIVAKILRKDKRMKEGMEGWEKYSADLKKNQESIVNSSIDIAATTFDIVMSYEDRKSERVIANLEKEQEALERRYAVEDALSESKSLAEVIREKRREKERSEISKKMEAEQAEQARRAKIRNIAAATQAMGLAVLDVMWRTPTGPLGKIAAAGMITAAAGATLASILNSREGDSSVEIQGRGNGTSDSELRRVSRGEVIIPERKVRAAGGSEKIKSLIDHKTLSSGNTVIVNVKEIISDRELVDRLAPRIKEVIRW